MIGTLLQDRYRLDAELGMGGMGVVYRAHDAVLDRNVAVKLLSASGLGTEGRERMLREAQAIAKLNHPNIVQVHDAGQLDGTPFIVMELVEGESLHDRPPKDFPDIVTVARQICAALEHAHQHGIIHRDLKPENVILGPDGSVKLMDFGLARSVASRMTTEGEITGTVFYLAPELALGQEGLRALEGAPASAGLADLLHETGRALYFNGQTEQAEPILRKALDMAEQTNALVVRIEALVTLGTTIAIAHPRSAQEGKQLLDEAVELARSKSLPDQESRALNNLGLIESEYLADPSKTFGYYMRAAELARATGSAASELFYLANACSSAMGRGDLNWVRERLTGLLEAVQQLESPGAAGRALRGINADLVSYSGELDAALSLWREKFEEGRKIGDVFNPSASFARIAVETRQHVDEALSMVEEASTGLEFLAPGTLLLLRSRLLIAQGNLAEARLALEQVKREAGGRPIGMSQMGYGLAQAELAVAEQDWEAARRAYAESVEFQGRVGLRWDRARTLWDWAEALIAEAKGTASEEARKLLDESRAEFEAMGAPIYAGRIEARLKELGQPAS